MKNKWKNVTLEQRFEKAFTPEPMSGCWLWIGDVYTTGYGRIHAWGKQQQAHRVSWIMHRGPIPNGLCVCHKCDIPQCINPDHLFLGTMGDNMRDKHQKGRSRSRGLLGKRHPSYTEGKYVGRYQRYLEQKLHYWGA